MRYTIEVSFTIEILYTQTVDVEAANSDQAREFAIARARHDCRWDDDEIDRSPYDTDILRCAKIAQGGI